MCFQDIGEKRLSSCIPWIILGIVSACLIFLRLKYVHHDILGANKVFRVFHRCLKNGFLSHPRYENGCNDAMSEKQIMGM